MKEILQYSNLSNIFCRSISLYTERSIYLIIKLCRYPACVRGRVFILHISTFCSFLYSAILSDTLFYSTLLYSTVLCITLLYFMLLYSCKIALRKPLDAHFKVSKACWHSGALCRPILNFSTICCSSPLYSPLLYSTLSSSTLLYSPLPLSLIHF